MPYHLRNKVIQPVNLLFPLRSLHRHQDYSVTRFSTLQRYRSDSHEPGSILSEIHVSAGTFVARSGDTEEILAGGGGALLTVSDERHE